MIRKIEGDVLARSEFGVREMETHTLQRRLKILRSDEGNRGGMGEIPKTRERKGDGERKREDKSDKKREEEMTD